MGNQEKLQLVVHGIFSSTPSSGGFRPNDGAVKLERRVDASDSAYGLALGNLRYHGAAFNGISAIDGLWNNAGSTTQQATVDEIAPVDCALLRSAISDKRGEHFQTHMLTCPVEEVKAITDH